MKTIPYWTREEEDVLKRNYPNKTNEELAGMLHRSVESVNSKATRLRLRKDFLHIQALQRKKIFWRNMVKKE